MSSLRMLDLFCGRGGATKGFMAEGWECVGVDLFPQPDYPARFVQRDALTVTAADLAGFDFVWSSSPCEQFSLWGLRCFHANPPFPELGLRLFRHAEAIAIESGKPFILENVRPAQKFVGAAVNHCGPYYLWGSAVPAIFPRDAYRVKKGISIGQGRNVKGLTQEQRREYRKAHTWHGALSSSSVARKEMTAKAAEIPLEVSRYIARYVTQLVGVAA